jgi:hypothetical protein
MNKVARDVGAPTEVRSVLHVATSDLYSFLSVLLIDVSDERLRAFG